MLLYTPNNYWLVRKSAAAAWWQGWFQFRFSNGTSRVSGASSHLYTARMQGAPGSLPCVEIVVKVFCTYWKNSSWFPACWDYMKAHYITKLKKRWLRVVNEGFDQFEDFENELTTGASSGRTVTRLSIISLGL